MTDIIPTLAPRTRHSHPDSPTVRLWATVLASQGLAYQLDDTSLFVPTELADQAIAEILAYEAENEPMPLLQAQPDSSSPELMIFALILMCMAGAEMLWPDMDWLGKGRAHAELIQHGEWWRCVTALFLHVDAGHLLSNLVALAVLTWLLSRTFGTGLVW
ncbi:MAG: rhomboid family intramembrane serine protease, partial [Desulfovibrionales bacterium]|nr:rhomboid family intramembrane serine protease [Desulfovibrionales bacterium]